MSVRYAAVLSLCLVSQASATNYWVRDSASGEYGAEDGSSYSNAFDGFSDVSGLTSSDTLYVCGTIRETLTISGPYTLNFNCPEADGAISGADIVTAWEAVDGNGEYLSTAATFTLPFTILRNGVAIKHGTETSLADDEWAFQGSTTNNVILGFNPSGYTIEVGVRANCVIVSSTSNVTIIGKDDPASPDCYGVRYSSSNGAAGITITDSSSVTMRDLFLYSMRGGVNVYGSSNGVSFTSGRLELACDALDANNNTTKYPTNVTFEDNYIEGCAPDKTSWIENVELTHVAVDSECIAGTAVSNNYTIRLNRLYDCEFGISLLQDAGISTTGWRIESNYVDGTVDDAIYCSANVASASYNCLISGNIVTDVGSFANKTTAYGFICSNSGDTFSSCAMNNNVAWDTANAYLASGLVHFTHKNNVGGVSVESGYSGSSRYQLNLTNLNASANVYSDYNRYYPTGVNSEIGWRWKSGTYRTTFSTYQSDSGQDANSSQVDPLFVDGLSLDGFKLQSGSTLFDAGVGVYGCRDVLANKCLGTPDIGAYQNQIIPYGYTLKPKKRR